MSNQKLRFNVTFRKFQFSSLKTKNNRFYACEIKRREINVSSFVMPTKIELRKKKQRRRVESAYGRALRKAIP